MAGRSPYVPPTMGIPETPDFPTIDIPSFEPLGKIVGRASPRTAHGGETITITAAVRNDGGIPGTFTLVLKRSGNEEGRVSVGYLTIGATSTTKTIRVTAPNVNGDVTYTLECRHT